MGFFWGLVGGGISIICGVADSPFRPYGGSLFPRAEKVTKKALLLVWPLLRRGSFTPVSLRGPAPNGHPCPDCALAASMRLGPLRETCVQPAPKSRLAVFGLLVFEDQKQIKGRCRSRASRLKPVLRGERRRSHWLDTLPSVGPALAGKRPAWAPSILGSNPRSFPRSAWACSP